MTFEPPSLFEQRPGSDSNEEHDDEISDCATNNMDITILEDGDEPMSYNGLDEELTEDFNPVSTLTLKKNLNEAFEKHAGEVKKTGVKAKIQAFEKVNSKEKKNARTFSKTKVRFEASVHHRPPPVPLSNSQANSGESRLAVYLRVRPPTASNEALQHSDDVLQNTVEIPCSGDINTKVITYPPIQSNTSKATRVTNHALAHSGNTVDLKAVECAVKGVKEFEFSEVFGPDSSQEDVFKSTAVPLIDGLFPKKDVKLVGNNVVGQSALLFTYGITNSGKTFTVMGREEKQNPRSEKNAELCKDHGIIPRAIDHLLHRIDDLNKSGNDDMSYSLNMSYLEIYNEDIYDLLPKKRSETDMKKNTRSLGSFESESRLQLRDLKNGKISVKGLAKYRVSSLVQGLTYAQMAKKKRHTSSNNINSASSRSHFICQFELNASQTRIQNNDDDNASVATEISGYTANDDESINSTSRKPRSVRFWVVDLAGSERSKRTGTFSRSVRQKEASLINSSLMNLMTCLRTLKNNQSMSNTRSKVPFRDSKLTHLFMGHLTGLSASRTSMVVNVNPSVADFDETQHVLCYAVDAKSVRIDKGQYNKKRQEIQPKSLHTHGEDGRPVKSRKQSPPRKMLKLAKKLSPRVMLARRREQQGHVLKKKANLKCTREISGSKSEKSDLHKPRLAGSKRKLEHLRDELDVERMKATRFRKDIIHLKEQLEKCETNIRQELAEETEAQIDFTRAQHEGIVRRLKQQLQNVSQTPSKSAKKARMDKADQIIEELMDKVEEGEEEMGRMREEQFEQAEQHGREMEQKEVEIAVLKNMHSDEMKKHQEEISFLKSELEDCDSTVLSECSDSDGAERVSDIVKEQENSRQTPTKEKENSRQTPTSSSRLKRLPRGRCSEVACANISPPNEKVARSNKKQRGLRIRSKHSPFKVLSANKKHSRSNSIVEDIIYPNSQPECDDNGLFQRPRGRAPQGRKWDKEAGGWTISFLQKV